MSPYPSLICHIGALPPDFLISINYIAFNLDTYKCTPCWFLSILCQWLGKTSCFYLWIISLIYSVYLVFPFPFFFSKPLTHCSVVKCLSFLLLRLLLDSCLFLPVWDFWEIEVMIYILALPHIEIFSSTSLPTVERTNTDHQYSSPNNQVHLSWRRFIHFTLQTKLFAMPLMFPCFLKY